MANRSILVMCRKGGVAKSTVAIALTNALDAAGVTMRLIDADSPRTGTKIDGASFAGVFGDRVEKFTITPEMEKVRADVNHLHQHWYPLFDAIRDSSSIVDFGANVNEAFEASWNAAGIGEEIQAAGTALDVVIPITVQPIALAAGLESVEMALSSMPGARVFVALVEKDGSFERYKAHPIVRDLLAAAERGVKFFLVPRCTSTLWAPVELARMDYRKALAYDKTLPNLAEYLGVSLRDTRIGFGELGAWYESVVEQFIAVGLVPKAAKKAAAAAEAKASRKPQAAVEG